MKAMAPFKEPLPEMDEPAAGSASQVMTSTSLAQDAEADLPLADLAIPAPVAYSRSNAFKAAVQLAEKHRMAICSAAFEGEFYKLGTLLGGLVSMTPSMALLKATGVGFLVNDKSLWRLAGPKVAQRA